MIGNKKRGSAWGGTKAAVWGLSIFTLVFGFALAGCSTDSDDGNSYAQWDDSLVPHEGTDGAGNAYRYGRWTGDGGTARFSRKPDGYSTVYARDDDILSYILESRDENTYTAKDAHENEVTFTATVVDGTLTISNSTRSGWDGTYTLQPAD